MTSIPASLTAKKIMKMKFFSKKIYCNSSWNVPNIANMQNPKWVYMHFNIRFGRWKVRRQNPWDNFLDGFFQIECSISLINFVMCNNCGNLRRKGRVWTMNISNTVPSRNNAKQISLIYKDAFSRSAWDQLHCGKLKSYWMISDNSPQTPKQPGFSNSAGIQLFQSGQNV